MAWRAGGLAGDVVPAAGGGGGRTRIAACPCTTSPGKLLRAWSLCSPDYATQTESFATTVQRTKKQHRNQRAIQRTADRRLRPPLPATHEQRPSVVLKINLVQKQNIERGTTIHTLQTEHLSPACVDPEARVLSASYLIPLRPYSSLCCSSCRSSGVGPALPSPPPLRTSRSCICLACSISWRRVTWCAFPV